MKNLPFVLKHSVLFLMLIIVGCGEEDVCENINRDSECEQFNYCNILDKWKLHKVYSETICDDDEIKLTEFARDIELFRADGSAEFVIDEVRYPFDKWRFVDCNTFELSKEGGDTTVSFTIKEFEPDFLHLSTTDLDDINDGCVTTVDLFLDRM